MHESHTAYVLKVGFLQLFGLFGRESAQEQPVDCELQLDRSKAHVDNEADRVGRDVPHQLIFVVLQQRGPRRVLLFVDREVADVAVDGLTLERPLYDPAGAATQVF